VPLQGSISLLIFGNSLRSFCWTITLLLGRFAFGFDNAAWMNRDDAPRVARRRMSGNIA
jgi:hypothetical protein